MPRQRRKRGEKVVQPYSQPPSQPSAQTPLFGPIYRLPPELIGAILSKCCTSVLLSTSCVSHLWRTESVRYLFREITITSYRPSSNMESLKPFVNFLDRSPHLQSHIVRLKLDQNGIFWESAAYPALHDRDVARIVQLLPNLESLDIELADVENTGAKVSDQDTITTTPDGKFVIDHLFIRRPTSSVNIARYLLHFRKIKTLRIIADDTKCTGNIHNLISRSTLEVETLELTAYSSYLNTLQTILIPSSLMNLMLNAASNSKINTSSLYSFLNTHGAHLQSFKYVAKDVPRDITILERSCLSTCTQLRTIFLSIGLYVTLITTTGIDALVSGWNACIELITSIPAELEHVTLTIPVSNDIWFPALNLHEVQETITSLPWTSIKDVIDKFPTIQQVEVVLVTGSGFAEAEDIARIQRGVWSKLGEKAMKKVNICVNTWAGVEIYDFDEWDSGNDEVYGSDSDD